MSDPRSSTIKVSTLVKKAGAWARLRRPGCEPRSIEGEIIAQDRDAYVGSSAENYQALPGHRITLEARVPSGRRIYNIIS